MSDNQERDEKRKVEVDTLAQPVKELDETEIKKVQGGLQQIQQTLNKVNETVTNLSRSQSDAEKSITQNLSV